MAFTIRINWIRGIVEFFGSKGCIAPSIENGAENMTEEELAGLEELKAAQLEKAVKDNNLPPPVV